MKKMVTVVRTASRSTELVVEVADEKLVDLSQTAIYRRFEDAALELAGGHAFTAMEAEADYKVEGMRSVSDG